MYYANARWLLWTCATLALLGVSYVYGFVDLMWRYDVTYLSSVIIVLYLACTASIFWKTHMGGHLYFESYFAALFPKIGILGTFIGLAIAFQALAHMSTGGGFSDSFKAEFMSGVMTKFYSSIVGLCAGIFLDMQIRILRFGKDED